MTPIRFVFLTLMFKVIIPSPTHGKIQLTFREAMSMSSSALEKRQFGNGGEGQAFRTLMICLDKLRHGTGETCDHEYAAQRMEEIKKKYIADEDVPLNVFERYAALRCLDELGCGTTCGCRQIKPSEGDDSPPCENVDRDKSVTCDAEYKAFHEFIAPPTTTPSNPVAGPNRGVSVSVSSWCMSVMAATAIYLGHLSSP